MHDLKIVHRDLKPQNILLKFPPSERRGRGQDKLSDWDIRLADFGYSRFYIEQGKEGDFANKTVDMESLAGTPVFMAPEALYCVMYPGGVYDHTVDMWSMGALLYRVLVGKCGFFAPIQDILRILQAKGRLLGHQLRNVFTLCSRRRHCFHAARSQDELCAGTPSGSGRHLDTCLQGPDDVASQEVSRGRARAASYLPGVL